MSVFEENEEILRRIVDGGNNLEPPRPVDFAHVFTDQASATRFAEAVRVEGFEVRIEKINDETDFGADPWDVTASRMMIPTCETITTTEVQLDTLAQSYGGRADGWGFLNI
jgi:hypothetical protein